MIVTTALPTVLCEFICSNYTIYKHFNSSQHISVSDPNCVPSFTSIPITLFEIQNEEQEQELENDRNMTVHILL